VEVLLDGEKISTLGAPWHPYGVTPVTSSITNLTEGSYTLTIQHTNSFEYYNETVYSHSVFHDGGLFGSDWWDYYYNVYHYRTVPCSDAEAFTVLSPLFSLSVNSGTGSGSYPSGAIIAITASNAPDGQLFDRWTGATQYVANVLVPSTVITIPAQDIAVTATYRDDPAADFTYTTNSGAITITGYTGPGGDVTIPGTINGLPVTAIDDTFGGDESLTGVSIPASVTFVGQFAFHGTPLSEIEVDISNSVYCSLNGVLFDKTGTKLIRFPEGKAGCYVMPEGVESVEDCAFQVCWRLTEVEFPSTLRNIGQVVFLHCSGLTNVVIPASITNIARGAFGYCDRLTEVYFVGNAPTIGDWPFYSEYYSKTIYRTAEATGWPTVPDPWGGWPTALWDPAANPDDYTYTTNNGAITITGYTGPGGSVTIPSIIDGLPVTEIGLNAFYSCGTLTNLTIPASVTVIGNTAFEGCSTLTNVVIGSGVTNIGYHVFFSCGNLASITVDGDNASFSSLDGILFNENQTELVLCPARRAGGYAVPDGVLRIANGAFDHCASLTEVLISGSVTNIADGAFYACTGLTDAFIGTNVFFIGNLAFHSCTGMTNLVIPDSVVSINGAFSDCTGLVAVQLGNSVVDIGGAFVRCSGLRNVVIPESVTQIGGNAFGGCSGLTNVVFSDGLTNILNGAFSGCASLTRIAIPDGVVYVGDYAFQNCTGLTHLTFGTNLVFIGSYAFQNCTGVASLMIGESVTGIGYAAFSGCSGLTNVLLSESVTNIEDWAFSGCASLTGAYFYGDAPAVGSSSFNGDISATVYRLDGAAGWPPVPDEWAGRPTALWSPPYLLTVSNGSGSGLYTNGAQIIITASNAPAGQIFDRWTGATQYVASVTSSVTAVTMPAENITVTAAYASGTAADFFDDFEATNIHPFWVASAANGTIALSTNRAHTGRQALAMTRTTGGQLTLRLTHYFSVPQYGMAGIWLYDSGPGYYSYIIVRNDASGIQSSLGVSDWNAGSYHWSTFNGASGTTGSRTPGWHLFVLNTTPSGQTVYLDGKEVYTCTNSAGFDQVIVNTSGPGGSGSYYYDDFSFTSYGSLRTDRDGDNLPDWWEEQYSGGATNTNPSGLCSNGVHTMLQAYIAGLDPTDPDAAFLTSILPGRILQWNAVSGRVYSVYWTTNLLSGFQCLESNIPWPQNSFTNPDIVPCEYYKIDVRLTP
jgi:hypothetical protein